VNQIKKEGLLTWDVVPKIRGIILLFGGGFALAKGFYRFGSV
jgi:hypothetical protein